MADKIVLDLRTRVLPPDEEVHILFPGEGYAFFELMRGRGAEGIAFLDFPGLEITATELLLGPEDLRERALRSDALREWHLRGRRIGAARPSSDLDEYRNARSTERRRSYVASIEKFYSLPDGSLIVVPGPGAYGQVLIGEVRGEPTQSKVPGYGDDTVPVRRVTWVAEVAKRRFSDEVLSRLSTPNPLVILDRRLRAEIVRLGYPNYAYGGEYVARFTTTERNFDSLDDFNIQAFVNYVAGCLAIIEAGTHDGKPVTLESALAALAAQPEVIPELTANINSPGALRYITQDVTSLVIAAFMGLALVAPTALAADITVVNSAAGKGDACAYMVDQRVRQAFEIMDIPSLQQACQRIQSASEKTGVKPAVKLSHPKGLKPATGD